MFKKVKVTLYVIAAIILIIVLTAIFKRYVIPILITIGAALGFLKTRKTDPVPQEIRDKEQKAYADLEAVKQEVKADQAEGESLEARAEAIEKRRKARNESFSN